VKFDQLPKVHKRNCLFIGILISFVILSSCAPVPTEENINQDSLPQPAVTTEKIPSPEPADDPLGDWMEYTNEAIQFRFLYPSSWYGPEVDQQEGSLRVEIGSDVVYPYGTDRTEQITTVPDSYYIVIQYFENTQGRTWDDFINSGWIDTYLGLIELQDGDSITTARSLTIREREISLGDFTGLEYIVTLSDTAQTEIGYGREVMAFDEDLNWLRVTGFPNLVEIADKTNWKVDYIRVDQANLEIFRTLVESIIINP
jgi:hypothetical protein